jgi:hypothetical protein
MVIAAFLCGLFYGGLFYAARQKARRLHSLDLFLERGMERLRADIQESECHFEPRVSYGRCSTVDECCGCGTELTDTSWPIPSEHGVSVGD